MDAHGNTPAASTLTAIKIDPDACTVELIMVEPEAVAHVLRSVLTETIDFENGHCLVIDDGNTFADHPSRFRFARDITQRPYFGPVLILGLANNNWAHATMNLNAIRSRIIWEHWDQRHRRYGLMTPEHA